MSALYKSWCEQWGWYVKVLSSFSFRYFLRVTIVRRLSDLVKEYELIVHQLATYPDVNNSIKMEVGIEDCLHIEFEYNKSKWELKHLTSEIQTIFQMKYNTFKLSSFTSAVSPRCVCFVDITWKMWLLEKSTSCWWGLKSSTWSCSSSKRR